MKARAGTEDRHYWWARQEHAFLLRCEGLKLKEIGSHLGVGKNRAWQMSIQFAHRFRKCNPRVKLHWEDFR